MQRGRAGSAAPAVRVAEYVYGAQHAFVYRILLESSIPSFTVHGAARMLGCSRPSLVQFILVDLEKIFLLRSSGPVFSLAPLLAVNKAVERVPDGHLLACPGGRDRNQEREETLAREDD